MSHQMPVRVWSPRSRPRRRRGPPEPVGWWQGVLAVEVSVDCGAQQHILRWADGTLQAVDHQDDDEEGESALVALGAPRRRCVDLMQAWHALDDTSAAQLARASTDKLAPPAWTAHVRTQPHASPTVALSSTAAGEVSGMALQLHKLDDLGEHLLMRRAMQGLAALAVSSPAPQRREAAKAQLNAIRQQMNLAPLEI